MGYCNHIRGLYGSDLISQADWSNISKKAEDRFSFYKDNFKKAHLYEVPVPPNLVEFRFCPFCGERV